MVDGALPRVPGIPKNELAPPRLPGLWALVWCSEEALQSPLLPPLGRMSILFIPTICFNIQYLEIKWDPKRGFNPLKQCPYVSEHKSSELNKFNNFLKLISSTYDFAGLWTSLAFYVLSPLQTWRYISLYYRQKVRLISFPSCNSRRSVCE